MKRHIAKISNTDQRCVVAFMQIPGRETHALVVPTDALPPRYEQALMEVLESPEGQNDECLAEVMGRRLMPDNGRTVLQTLHEQNYLVPVPVSNVIMMPVPNMPFPLAQVLSGMGRSVPSHADGTPVVDPSVARYDQHAVNRAALSAEASHGIARNLLVEAEMLENEARRKRETAYSYAPDLAPKLTASDSLNVDVSSVTLPTEKAAKAPKTRTPRAKKSV